MAVVEGLEVTRSRLTASGDNGAGSGLTGSRSAA